MKWTAKRIGRLRELWPEGHTASQIAADLGGVSRSAVIGKAHRLGLPGRGQKQAPAIKKRSEGTPNIGRLKSLAEQMKNAPQQDNSGEGYRMIDLEDNQCRWPINDAKRPEDHRFCGAPTDGSYCEDHARRVYQPRSGRPREMAMHLPLRQ